jgi:hypothetical protein
MNIEHAIWQPKAGSRGINGEHIAIVGYSHFYNPKKEVDRTDLTCDVLQRISCGLEKQSFFTSVRNYFDFSDSADFWGNVFFFNFVPNCIGNGDQRFNSASPKQVELGQERVLRIIKDEHKIQRIFVFSRKAWRDFPPTIEEDRHQPCHPLFRNSREPSWGTYRSGDRHILACGFEHPLGANGKSMRDAIREFWKIK